MALTVFEDLLNLFVPATLLLRGLSGQMATWNAVVGLGLTAAVNGLLCGTIAAAAAAVLPSLQDRRRQQV